MDLMSLVAFATIFMYTASEGVLYPFGTSVIFAEYPSLMSPLICTSPVEAFTVINLSVQL